MPLKRTDRLPFFIIAMFTAFTSMESQPQATWYYIMSSANGAKPQYYYNNASTIASMGAHLQTQKGSNASF